MGASSLSYKSVSLAKIFLMRLLLEKIVFNSTHTDPVNIALFVCQFARSVEYLTWPRRFISMIFLAGMFFPRTVCLDGK